MKKIILSFAILLMATTAFAKRPTGLNIGGGFANNFMVLGNNSQSYFGGFAEVGYNAKFSKMSGMYLGGRWSTVYSSEYQAASIYGVTVREDATTTLHYLEIPVKYAFQTTGRTRFFFDLGPTVNFWLGARTHYSGTSTQSSGVYTETIKWFDLNAYNRVNLSIGGNIGVWFNHVKIYAAYDQGLFSITKKDYGFNNVGQLRIGAAFVW